MGRVVEYPDVGTRWRHWKTGATYAIVAVARNTETGVDEVVYRSEMTGDCFCRPVGMWKDLVLDGDMGYVPRFMEII